MAGFWGALNRNHSIKSCHPIFLENSPDHTVVKCRGLAFVRVGVIFIRAYRSVRKYKDYLGIDMIINMITSTNILFHFRTGWVGTA